MAKDNNEELNLSSIVQVSLTIIVFVLSCIAGVCFESFWIGVILFIIGFGWVFKKFVLKDGISQKLDGRPAGEFEFRADGTGYRSLRDSEYFCHIAGVEHRNADEGAFIGHVCPDPSNSYDENAIGVYRLNGELVGYIPKTEQKDYKNWTDKKDLPCIGFYTYGYNGKLQGKVKVIDADRTLTEIHIIKFVIWLIEKHGVDFIPSEYFVYSSATRHSEDAWLDHLEDCLAERQTARKSIDKEMKKKQEEVSSL